MELLVFHLFHEIGLYTALCQISFHLSLTMVIIWAIAAAKDWREASFAEEFWGRNSRERIGKRLWILARLATKNSNYLWNSAWWWLFFFSVCFRFESNYPCYNYVKYAYNTAKQATK